MNSRETLGVDIGGVIIARAGAGEDTSFSSENYLEAREVTDAFEVLKRLVNERFGRRVFLISKAGPRVRAKTMHWLKHHRFFERTGAKAKQVLFCLERSHKAPLCRELGITHFVDDRLDVLQSLKTVLYRFLFDPGLRARNVSPAPAGSIHTVTSWDEIGAALLQRSR